MYFAYRKKEFYISNHGRTSLNFMFGLPIRKKYFVNFVNNSKS